MIGIVIVSHSHRLAEGVKELADQMAQGRIPIAAAGGLDDSTIGTSFERVAAAVDAAYQPEGVLVLMDLGSAVMTTEMVRDMLPQAQQPHVRLTNAPLVEGAIAAAVAAALGDPLDKVEAAALGALHPSKVADAPAVGGDSVVLPMGDVTDGVEEILTIVNRVGLHARPASQFVQTAGRFNADVRVRNLTRPSAPVDAKSMFGVLGLNARQGDQIAVIASGPEAAAAALALRDLVRAGFGEDTGTDEAAPVASAAAEPAVATAMRPAAGEAMPGIAASPGVALGPAYLHRAEMPRVVRRTVQDRGAEWRRLEDALTKARGALEQLARRTGKQIGKAEAMIFEAQRQFLEDPALIMAVRDKIEREGLNAEAAMFDAASDFAQMLESMEGEIFRQRAADVRDVAARVLRDLGGQSGGRV
jgi:phosphocarrier protein FPr